MLMFDDKVGGWTGSKNGQKHADIILEWSHSKEFAENQEN